MSEHATTQILPGATIGVLGGGQLGRMLCQAAMSMGYRIVVLDPDSLSPAGSIAAKHICADFDDTVALDELAAECDVITSEFENIPAETLCYLGERRPVFPDADALEIAQHRAREKTFARDAGLKPADFAVISERADIETAISKVGLPAVLKSATLGYDGKGQSIVATEQDAVEAFSAMGEVECVIEKLIAIDTEISVIVARNGAGELACFPPSENVHVNGILHTSSVPADVPIMHIEQAVHQAKELASALGYIGVLAVEFFISEDGELLFNEMAPRTHNSGHYTGDACVTSQFEQQVRTICGLTPGDARLVSPVVMVNMLGDLWEPDWSAIFAEPNIKLHLYGKKEARAGRKMGHFNVLAETREQAANTAEAVFRKLSD